MVAAFAKVIASRSSGFRWTRSRQVVNRVSSRGSKNPTGVFMADREYRQGGSIRTIDGSIFKPAMERFLLIKLGCFHTTARRDVDGIVGMVNTCRTLSERGIKRDRRLDDDESGDAADGEMRR